MTAVMQSPAAVYAALSRLQPGDAVPERVYVADYADGERPAWIVAERAALGCVGVRLVLHDTANSGTAGCAAVIVLSFPTKTLRTPVQLSTRACIGESLCDMLQQGRHSQRQHRRQARRTATAQMRMEL